MISAHADRGITLRDFQTRTRPAGIPSLSAITFAPLAPTISECIMAERYYE